MKHGKGGKKVTENIDEKLLIRKIQNGEPGAFEILYDRYFNILYSYSYYIVKNQVVAEDIVEDVFIKIWEKHESININISLKAYMFQMVKNSCLDYIKSKNIRQSYKKEIQENFNIENQLEPLSTDPLNNLINTELNKMIKKEIDKLPLKTRRIFKMSRYYQIKNKDIAVKEKVSESTVEKSIRKVLDILSDKLKNYLLITIIFAMFYSRIYYGI